MRLCRARKVNRRLRPSGRRPRSPDGVALVGTGVQVKADRKRLVQEQSACERLVSVLTNCRTGSLGSHSSSCKRDAIAQPGYAAVLGRFDEPLVEHSAIGFDDAL